MAVLAYYKVLEDFGKDEKQAAKAAYDIGMLYQRMGRRDPAIGAYAKVVRDFSESRPEKELAAIRLATLEGEKAWEAAPTDFKRKQILKDAILHIQKISASAPIGASAPPIEFRPERSWPRRGCWEIWVRMRHRSKKPFLFWTESEQCRI